MSDTQASAELYQVVVNHEEQYSVWPKDREMPLGWREVGQSGDKKTCLEWIENNWTDMRPAGLRAKMAEAGV